MLRVSTGAKIIVWRADDTYQARLADSAIAPEVCLAIDLFEVIAELSGLDLDEGAQAAEAMALAHRAQRLLGHDEADNRNEGGRDLPGEHGLGASSGESA